MLSEDLSNVNPKHELYVYMRNVIACDDDDIEMRGCWCWWCYWDEVMLMLVMILRWGDVDVGDDIEMRWYWWWHCDEMMLMLMMPLRWMHVVYVHGGAVTLSEYPWRGKRIGLKIISVPREGRGLFKKFNYPSQCIVGAYVSHCIIVRK